MRYFLLVFAMLSAVNIYPQMPEIEPGVSQSLAEWRAKRYSDIRYKLDLTLEKMSPVLKGSIEIKVTVAEPPASAVGQKAEGSFPPIILDWRKIKGHEASSTISNVSLNGKDVAISTVWPPADTGGSDYSEHLIFTNGVVAGENVIKLDFTSPILTSGSAITRYIDKEDGSEYIYSLFVPSDASTAFPVFDQPDLKAKFRLSIKTTNEWKTVSNTSIHSSSVISELKTQYFEETAPISTYIFAFASGPFRQVQRTYPNESFGLGSGNLNDAIKEKPSGLIYVRKSQFEKFKPHIAEVFRLNREAIKYLEEYFDYKFPFSKYDLVLIPEFPFGGMEHAGATFLRESAVIFPQEPTKGDEISRALLIFHEAAHQWFGDTVTMRWFDDLWLKEGFANFAAYKTLEKVMPEANAWKVFYERVKQAAYRTDSTKGTTPIYQKIDNLSSAKSAYGNIVYNKAPAFLRQAEFYLGEDKFKTAVRAFLKKHEFKNATWEDLVREFEISPSDSVSQNSSRQATFRERVASKENNWDKWSRSWLTTHGLILIHTAIWPFYKSLDTHPTGAKYTETVQVVQKRHPDPPRTVASVRFETLVKFANTTTETLDMSFISNVHDSNYFFHDRSKIVLVFPNYRDYGYGIFLLDEKSRDYVIKNVHNEKDDFLRSMMYGALWDSVREVELDPKLFVEKAIKDLSTEKDESIVSSLIGRVNTALTYYLSKTAKDKFLPSYEKTLLERMKTSETNALKITFFRAFTSVAESDTAVRTLKEIKSGEIKIKGIDLKLKDRYEILNRLVILGDSDSRSEILSNFSSGPTLEEKYGNEEAKYIFACAAGLPSEEIKKYYFDLFTNNEKISESWIEAAFVNFNSPRQADLTFPYLEKALKELPAHKQKRKIFFVNGWLAAFIGGQTSTEALNTVNNFLSANPTLDKDLRLKILENVDLLERADKIKKRFGS